MWNSPNKQINPADILRHHIDVLIEAVNDAEMYDIRSKAVYEALDYIEAERPYLKWPCTQFRQALENWSPEQLHQAMVKIKTALY